MPRPRTRKSPSSTGGAAWRRTTGQKLIGLTLPEEESRAFRALAVSLGLSGADFGRTLARWAVKASQDKGIENLKKILGLS